MREECHSTKSPQVLIIKTDRIFNNRHANHRIHTKIAELNSWIRQIIIREEPTTITTSRKRTGPGPEVKRLSSAKCAICKDQKLTIATTRRRFEQKNAVVQIDHRMRLVAVAILRVLIVIARSDGKRICYDTVGSTTHPFRIAPPIQTTVTMEICPTGAKSVPEASTRDSNCTTTNEGTTQGLISPGSKT